MKKQSTGILESLFNSQETIENQKSISNTQETCISKNLSNVEKSLYSQISLSSTQESFSGKFFQSLPNVSTHVVSGGGQRINRCY